MTASLEAMRKVETFHFEMDADIKMASGDMSMEVPFTYVGDYQAPDRTRGKITLALGFLSLEMETITIGDKSYVTNPQTGEWEVSERPVQAVPEPSELAATSDTKIEDLELLGEEVLNGTPVLYLKGKPPEELLGSQGGSGKIELWIGAEDQLVRKMLISGEMSLGDGEDIIAAAPVGPGDLPESASMTMTLTVSDYNKAVSIEAPIQ